MPDINKALKIFSREGEERAIRLKAQKIGLPYVSLVGYPLSPEILTIIPKEQARKFQVIAFYKINDQVKVAAPAPNSALVAYLRDLAVATNLKFYLYLCSESSLRYALEQLEFVHEPPRELTRHTVSEAYIQSKLGGAQSLAGVGARIAETSTTEVLDIVFAGAIHLDGSDIHLEPIETGVRLRYRIDGILQDVADLPRETYKAINSRIKYLSKLKMNVTDQPQDGRFEIALGKLNIDVRVSLVPGAWGEVIVCRLLNPSGVALTLEELGFRREALSAIDEAISKPNGAIFLTGPTGSGKTTTMYAILQKLNSPEVKIVTLEDPIEYRIEGINQSQVNPAKGYDFASGLKHALRQDPDIIMVGEIRDKETAETALQASLTGHLVLTSLHTNSAPSAIPRLLDLGVRPFLLSGSINLIIAQRLVRRLCKQCRNTAAKANCVDCRGTGYKGRVAIVESIKITPRVERLITAGGTVAQFESAAREDGMVSMAQDGQEKVRLGITSEEEVKRVAGNELGNPAGVETANH